LIISRKIQDFIGKKRRNVVAFYIIAKEVKENFPIKVEQSIGFLRNVKDYIRKSGQISCIFKEKNL